MKVVFFGTSNVALPILESLSRHYEIGAVVTSPDAKVGRKGELTESPVSVLAREMQLKTLKPEKVKGNAELLEELREIQAELFVVVSYGKILPEEVINLPQFKTINVHFSLLPKYRGPSPIQHAILNGEKETGTSIFILDKEVDHGPILAQQKFSIDPDDNFITLSQKLAFKSAELLLDVIPSYTSGSLMQKEQDHSQAAFTKIIIKQDGKIDWSKTSLQIYNQFRAFYPWPGIWTTWNGKILKITECFPSDLSTNDKQPGLVTDNGIVVCGGNTALKISRLQLEGKNEMAMNDFLNGYKDFIGSQLN